MVPEAGNRAVRLGDIGPNATLKATRMCGGMTLSIFSKSARKYVTRGKHKGSGSEGRDLKQVTRATKVKRGIL
jgi:hypothetical protein